MNKVIVVGAGALGSHLLVFARNLPVEFTIIDFDRIEQKNVLSQFHPKTTVGQNKAQSLQKMLNGLFGMSCKAIPHKLTKDNVDVLLKDAVVVVDCLDNSESRILLQTFATKNNVPCLHGALAAGGQLGMVNWDTAFKIDQEVPGQPTCENGEFLSFIVEISAVMVSVLQQFIKTGGKAGYMIHPTKRMRIA